MAEETKKDEAVTEETTSEDTTAEAAPAAEDTAAEAPAAEPASHAGEDAPADDDSSATTDTSSASEGEAEVEVPERFKALVEQVEQMSVLELHELVKVLENRFGVSASAVAVAAPGGGEGAEEAEEQSEFTVELAEVGAQKIAVIKAVKESLGLGLKEAKDLVDGAPAELKQNMKKEEAEELKAKIEEAGATINLK